MKFDKIYGIIICIQASLFEVFAVYVLIPYFELICRAISGHYTSPFYYVNENDGGMFVFVFWLLIFIAGAICEIVGMSKIKKACQQEEYLSNLSTTYANNNTM